MSRGIRVRGDNAQRHVTHAVEDVVIHHVTRADQADARLVQTTLVELLHHLSANARWHEDKQRVRCQVTHLLQERGEVGAAHGHAQRVEDLPAIKEKPVLEGALRIQARAVVRHQGHHLLDAILGGPVRNAQRDLRQRHRHAHHVGRGINHG